MTQPPGQKLTPQFCFSAVALRDFLRISRSFVDDSISQNINAFNTPSSRGFDPRSTSQRYPRIASRQMEAESCQTFQEAILFPSWQARSEVLNYCAMVATVPDPDDSEAVLREAEKQRDRERIIDERLDPYSGKFYPKEARTEKLAVLIRQEKAVESIVRSRTWGVIQDRCGDRPSAWEEAFDKWNNERHPKKLPPL